MSHPAGAPKTACSAHHTVATAITRCNNACNCSTLSGRHNTEPVRPSHDAQRPTASIAASGRGMIRPRCRLCSRDFARRDTKYECDRDNRRRVRNASTQLPARTPVIGAAPHTESRRESTCLTATSPRRTSNVVSCSQWAGARRRQLHQASYGPPLWHRLMVASGLRVRQGTTSRWSPTQANPDFGPLGRCLGWRDGCTCA